MATEKGPTSEDDPLNGSNEDDKSVVTTQEKPSAVILGSPGERGENDKPDDPVVSPGTSTNEERSLSCSRKDDDQENEMEQQPQDGQVYEAEGARRLYMPSLSESLVYPTASYGTVSQQQYASMGIQFNHAQQSPNNIYWQRMPRYFQYGQYFYPMGAEYQDWDEAGFVSMNEELYYPTREGLNGDDSQQEEYRNGLHTARRYQSFTIPTSSSAERGMRWTSYPCAGSATAFAGDNYYHVTPSGVAPCAATDPGSTISTKRHESGKVAGRSSSPSLEVTNLNLPTSVTPATPMKGGGQGVNRPKSPAKARKRKKKNDDGRPMRPRSAYNFFYGEERLRLLKDNKRIPLEEMTALISSRWRALQGKSSKERMRYEVAAMCDKQRYTAERRRYKRQRQEHMTMQQTQEGKGDEDVEWKRYIAGFNEEQQVQVPNDRQC